MLNRVKFTDSKKQKEEKLKPEFPPWKIAKMLFDDESINPDEINVNIIYIIKVMSFDRDLLIEDCDDLNYFFPFTKQQWITLLRICFRGKQRYLNFISLAKDKGTKLQRDYLKRVRQYFRWTTKEYEKSSMLLESLSDFPDLLQKLGFDAKETEQLVEELKEEV